MSQCLFTVTCDRDRWSFLQQYNSVNYFLQPCTWYIVINELDEKPWLKWFKKNRKKSPHKIVFLSLRRYLWKLHPETQRYILSLSGYWRQLYLKLLIHLHCREKRIVVLDSKNWLAKKCELSDFPQQNKKPKDNTVFYGTIDFFEKFWNIETPWITNNITPHILHKKTLEKMWKEFRDENTGIMYLKNQNFKSIGPTHHQSGFLAEFFMYDIFCQKKDLHQDIIRDDSTHCLYAWFSPNNFEDKDKFVEWFEYKNLKFPPLSVTIKWYVEEEGGSLDDNHRKQILDILMKDSDK
jgi:hypothetical protein